MVNHPRRSRKAVAVATLPEHDHDADYAALLVAVRATFAAARGALFTTSAEGLAEVYLGHLGDERQVHTCSSCRRFIENFGALVTIAEDGHTASALWEADAVPEFYRDAVNAMSRAVSRSKVTGVFLASEAVWGTPNTGEWTHFAVASPSVYQRRLLTAGQTMAAKREDFGTVARALADFPPNMIAEAVRLVEAGHLARSDKFVAPLHFLADLHAKRAEAKDSRIRDNLLWRAIAAAPDGFCHPRTSVIGPLLEDIAAGLPFVDVKARFDAKMHPLQYQRPQAAPTAGNLAEAEKIVEKLGIARSLERRFARLDEVRTVWLPAAPKAPSRPTGGVFAHLSAKGDPSQVRELAAPAVVMTWEKFVRAVLPGAEAIEVQISVGNMNFIALTTAVHMDAPPILKWDREDDRYPVSPYVYHNGSPASQWRMVPGGWAKVNAIATLPTDGFVLVLDGCADTRTGQGNALFPECLIGDLHGVRATIESYSKRAELSGREEASACGLGVPKGAKAIGYRLRITTSGLRTDYQLDRWD